MKKTQTAKPKKRKSFILRFAILAFAVYAAVSLLHTLNSITPKTQQLQQLQTQLSQQQLENERLRKVLENGDEAAYMERIARDKLGLVMPDEKVIYDTSGN